MARVCFTLQVRPDRLAEYRAAHSAVWPQMLAALQAAGWHDYSLHLRADGLLVGTLVTDDLAAAQAAMSSTDVNARWQAAMSGYFIGLDGGPPDQGVVLLDAIFDLESQLTQHRSTGEQS